MFRLIKALTNSVLWRSMSFWQKRFQFPYTKSSSTLLIVKLDEIGDYILFRNFLSEIKNSYPKHQIVLIGNILWRDLYHSLDSKYVDDCLFLDKSIYFSTKISTRFKTLRFVYRLKPEIIVQPTYSRNKVEDDIIRFSGAPVKIGFKSDGLNLNRSQIESEQTNFTQLIDTSKKIEFEFKRNKHFFESFLKKELHINLPSIPCEIKPASNCIIISPGAGNPSRMWSQENISELCSQLVDLNYDITLIGSSSEVNLGNNIEKKVANPRIKNLIGKTTLNELPEIISSAKLVICHDSSVFHMAAAVQKNTICLSNGNHLNRFVPYPEECRNIQVLFPPSIDLHHPEEYQVKSDLDINTISVELVLTKVKEVLNA